MQRTLPVLIALGLLFSSYGFNLPPQDTGASVQLLDSSGSSTTRITDGDTVSLQVMLSQPVSSPQTITFKLDDLGLSLASCTIPSGSTCKTDPVNTLGWHWDASALARDVRLVNAYDAAGGMAARSASITVLPRPVVLVHGFISSWDTWKPYLGTEGFLASLGLRGFAVGDGQVQGTMNTGLFTDPTRRTNTIAQNAAIEAAYIAAVKKATGAQMVDLVVHSMGGMISRYYIDRLMQDRDVAQLIMLGSPMGGTDCSVLPAALGFYLPASLEIRQSYMQGVFNRQVIHRRGVEFYDLAGTAIAKPFESPCAAVPNDLAVPLESVNAIPLQSSSLVVLHTELTTSPAVFQSFVQPLLQKPAGSFLTAPDPAASNSALPPLQFTRLYTGHVAPQSTQELSITIEPNVTVASFALYDPTRSLNISVRGASGNVIALDPQANGFVRVTDPSSLFYLGYGFSNPKPGVWKVSVLSTDLTPPAGADFSISVYFVGGPVLEARSSTLIPKLGESVKFEVILSLNGQPLEVVGAQAVIRAPDGGVESADFTTGAQASASWTPREAGIHGVDILVTGKAPDGSQIERTAFLSEDVQPTFTRLGVTLNLVLVLLGILGLIAVLIWFFFRSSARLFQRRR